MLPLGLEALDPIMTVDSATFLCLFQCLLVADEQQVAFLLVAPQRNHIFQAIGQLPTKAAPVQSQIDAKASSALILLQATLHTCSKGVIQSSPTSGSPHASTQTGLHVIAFDAVQVCHI